MSEQPKREKRQSYRGNSETIFPVAKAKGNHLYTCRTQKLSPLALMVLGWTRPGRVCRCRSQEGRRRSHKAASFFISNFQEFRDRRARGMRARPLQTPGFSNSQDFLLPNAGFSIPTPTIAGLFPAQPCFLNLLNHVSSTRRTFSAPHGCSRPTLLTCLPGNPNAAYMPSGQFARWKLGCSFNCYAECYVFACPACHSRYILFVWKQLKINRESITLSRL